MFRRDLSSVIRLFSVLLGLFILFQVWIKPTDSDHNQQESVESSEIQPMMTEPAPPLETTPLLETAPLIDALEARLINPGSTPSAELGHIRDDLDRGNYQEVEARLHKLPKKLLADERSKQFAAALWNNLGVQQEKFAGVAVSVKAFKQAVTLAPKNPVALLNLTQAYWELHDEALTQEFLESVLLVAPNDTFSHIALADIQIQNGHTMEAERHLKLIHTRALADPSLKTYFQQLTGKLGHEIVAGQTEPVSGSMQPATSPSSPVVAAQAPSPLSPSVTQRSASLPVASAPNGETTGGQTAARTTEPFTVTFDGKPDQETAMRIRSILDYAHEDISKKFGYTPTAPIQVVLHTEQKFAPDASSPAGADMLYDHNSSVIHLPVDGAMEDLAILSRVLRHQFAHALLHNKMRTQMKQLPVWFVEGLAIRLAEDPWPALEEAKQKPFSVIPLSLLEKQWDRTQPDKSHQAYLESASAAQSLIDRHGIYCIRQIMNLLQAGQSFEAAIKEKWSLSYEQFQRDWEKSFTASMGQK